jgi:hypothetical protein
MRRLVTSLLPAVAASGARPIPFLGVVLECIIPGTRVWIRLSGQYLDNSRKHRKRESQAGQMQAYERRDSAQRWLRARMDSPWHNSVPFARTFFMVSDSGIPLLY